MPEAAPPGSRPELRGVLVGCGFFSRNHLYGWGAVEGASIVAVCDADRERAEARAAEHGIPAAYADAEAMLRAERPDFVDIVTQAASHRPLAELAARHGVNVVCQKPLALGLEDASAIVVACRAAGVRLMVHENFRWQDPMRALKAASLGLGKLFFGRISFRTPYDVYAQQPYLARDERFILADVGVHLLDLARYFLGEAHTLSCYTRRVNPAIRGEDVATVLLRSVGGAACVVDMSYASRLEADLFPQTLVHLEGERGTARLGPGYELTVTDAGRVLERRTVAPRLYPWSEAPGQAVQQSVVAIEQHWADCLRSGHEPETSGEDNLRTLALVEGAYASAASGELHRAGRAS